jgi:hypothetical protein
MEHRDLSNHEDLPVTGSTERRVCNFSNLRYNLRRNLKCSSERAFFLAIPGISTKDCRQSSVVFGKLDDFGVLAATNAGCLPGPTQ